MNKQELIKFHTRETSVRSALNGFSVLLKHDLINNIDFVIDGLDSIAEWLDEEMEKDEALISE